MIKRVFRLPAIPSRPITSLNRPAPPPLPREQQREFEQLQHAARTPSSEVEAELALHPHARQTPKPDFEGDTNPLTGEIDGPKTEPVAKWVKQDHGDWSFNGRVSDF